MEQMTATRLCAYLLSGALVMSHANGGRAGDPPITITDVLDSHTANLDGFTRFTCRYDRTFATAASVEDALAGRYTRRPRTAKVLWVRDGKRMSLKVVQDEETTNELKNPKVTPMPGQPNLGIGPLLPHVTQEYLTNPNATLSYLEQHACANVAPSPNSHPRLAYLLFGCACSTVEDRRSCEDQGVQLSALHAREPGKISAGRHTVDNKDYIKLSTDTTSLTGAKNTLIREYLVDPARGYQFVRWYDLPSVDHPAASRLHLEYPDPRDCGNGRWFPGRVVRMIYADASRQWLVYDSRVTELVVDKAPDPAHFTIRMPAGTTVMDFDDSRKRFKTKQPETIDIDDIPTLYKMTQSAAENPLMDTAVEVHRPNRYRWAIWGGSVAAVVLVAGVVRRVFRRRAPAAPPSPEPATH
jgi:hypothetical protein